MVIMLTAWYFPQFLVVLEPRESMVTLLSLPPSSHYILELITMVELTAVMTVVVILERVE